MINVHTPALDKFLSAHRKGCRFWVFSGDRRCSCGREEALKELAEMRAELESLQQPTALQMDLFTEVNHELV